MAGYLPRRNRSIERPQRIRDRQQRPSSWQYSCGLCNEDHALRTCRRFIDKSPHARYEVVERREYCRNCLAKSHLAPDCPAVDGCHKCDQRHHTLLHGAPQLFVRRYGINDQPPNNEPSFRRATVFVPTAMVRVATTPEDTWASIRAIFNTSSTITRLAESTCKRLDLSFIRQQGRKLATFFIKSRHANSTWFVKVTALITNELPRRPYSDPIIENPAADFTPSNIADPDPCCNTPIDLEIGADIYTAIQQEGVINTGLGRVHALKTSLGVVFCGPVQDPV